MAQSKELTSFYQELWTWIQDPSAEAPFSNDVGLCSNLLAWLKHYGMRELRAQLSTELCEQFQEAELDVDHPFNEDYDEYFEESHREVMFSNPKRIQWIMDHIKE